MTDKTIRFYELAIPDRLDYLRGLKTMSEEQLSALHGTAGLTIEHANAMIENAVGLYGLPLGIAQHFLINGRELLVPMVIEEPSVVAGASFMAKLARAGGGFSASADEPIMIGQMQVLDIPDIQHAMDIIHQHETELLQQAAQLDPVLSSLGGGPRKIETRLIEQSSIGPFLVIHWLVDVRDAMGANAVNTIVENMTPVIERLTGGRVHLRILSNLADHRLARAACTIPVDALAFDGFTGEQVRDRILAASAFAASDPYRAATHNKGIMNGVDAVVLATANDWRAVEAGAHAYAARSGTYTSLSLWQQDANGNLHGELEMPMAVGIIGGATRVHPGAQAALALMGIKTASELAEIILSVGLAQNLAALRALATEGIQHGHMGLHARQVAVSAGAAGAQIERLAEQLIQDKNIRIDHAREILKDWGK